MAQDKRICLPFHAHGFFFIRAMRAALSFLLVAGAAHAALEEVDYERLETAYAEIAGVAADAPEGEESAEGETAPLDSFREAVGDPEISRSDWHDFFQQYYEKHVLDPAHMSFWGAAIRNDEATAVAMTELSAVAAAEALTARVPQSPPDLDSTRLAIGWLSQMAASLPPPQLEGIGNVVLEALRGEIIDLEPLLTIGPQTPPLAVVTGIELAIVVSVFLEIQQVPRVLRLPASGQAFWNEQQILLFDNGVLSPQHLASLASLFASVPRELHNLYAILVPEAIGIAPTDLTLVPATTAMMVEVAPLDLLTDPTEFIQGTGRPAAPQFTINAAAGLMQAIQYQQFSLRPELVHRRNLILSNAGFRSGRYPRRYIEPAVYLQNPDSLLPLTSYLWFIDSSSAFNQMLQLFTLEQDQAMDIGLLLADTLSGGSAETLVFTTTPAGIVSSMSGALQRTMVAPGISYVTGIAVGGEVYTFALGPHGSVDYLDHY
jgi:hypothetical protein